MAKNKDKENKSKKTDDKAADKAGAPEFKFGVSDVAEALDIKPASVRVQLRNKGIEKAGKSYGWNTQKELDEVVKALKADKPAAEGKGKSKKGDDDEGAGKGKKDKKGKKNKKD